MSFKKYLKRFDEDTMAGDIASVERMIGFEKRKKQNRNNHSQKCKKHKILDCEICDFLRDDGWDD